MNKFRFTLTALAVLVFCLAAASSANAQATRTWVSGVGDDVNPCSRTAPCKTLAGAISKTATNGQIDCLDPAAVGAVTITKSITIDCHEEFAGVLHTSTNGVNINFDSFAGTDTRKSVRLVNLDFQGADSGLRSVSINGGVAATNTEVIIEDCLMDGNFGGTGNGVRDNRAGGGLLVINNTTIRNMLGAGVSVAPGSSTSIKVSISNSEINNCGFGVATGTNAKTTIFNTVITGNTTGVFADSSAPTTEMAVDHCVVSNNGTGINASSGNTVIRVSNTTLANNTTLFTVAGGGQVLSYGNNQTGGVVLGTAVGQN